MRCLLLSALALTVSLTACNRGDEEANADQAVVARTSETDLPAWLTHSDGTDPGRWLAAERRGTPWPSTRRRCRRCAGASSGLRRVSSRIAG